MAARPPSLPPATLAALHPLPQQADYQVPRVFVKHLGYNEPVDLLFHLPALDACDPEHNDDDQVAVGVHHRTVVTAGAILANNAFDRAYLASDKAGLRRVEERVPLDGILPPGDYWLHVPSPPSSSSIPSEHDNSSEPMGPPPPPPYLYPVIPTFQHWPFPHAKLPVPWSAPHAPPQMPDPSPGRKALVDKISQQKPEIQPCCITAQRSGRERSHIVPQLHTD